MTFTEDHARELIKLIFKTGRTATKNTSSFIRLSGNKYFKYSNYLENDLPELFHQIKIHDSVFHLFGISIEGLIANNSYKGIELFHHNNKWEIRLGKNNFESSGILKVNKI